MTRMLLTITLEREPAGDLGYLLHKHPERMQTFALNFGSAHVFYPEFTETRCTAALLLDVDAIGLVRGRGNDALASHYVNDRPYVASSFMSVALAEIFRSALNGRCRERPELAELELPFIARMSAVPCRGHGDYIHELFGPLGYEIRAKRLPLDEQFPEWGDSVYYQVELHHRIRLQELLSHLYILLPVLDNDKHYWVGDDEVQKLLHHGSNWLAGHPHRERIAQRYLKHQSKLVRSVLSMLRESDGLEESPLVDEPMGEEKLRLNDERIQRVVDTLKATGAKRVLDLGCGEGKLLRALAADPQFETIIGMDVSPRTLEIAVDRLYLDRVPDEQQTRIQLHQGSLMYRDQRLLGFDAAAIVEVVEHLDPARLLRFEQTLFGYTRPRSIVLTTPNREYNIRFGEWMRDRLRHADHRFEWTRAEFQAWAEGVASRYGYAVTFDGIGDVDEALGTPTQLALFRQSP